MIQAILERFKKPQTTGVTCDYCGWNGSVEDVFLSRRMNENGTTYEIKSCPSCGRNGGLVYPSETE